MQTSVVARARNLAPGYFEVHRVEAIIRVSQQDYSAAQTAYETAVELNPRSAALRFWYGGFLLNHLFDTVGAYNELKTAAALDPHFPGVHLELSRACLYLRKFDEAQQSIDMLLTRLHDLHPAQRPRVYDAHLRLHTRKADHLSMQNDWPGALGALEALRKTYESYPENVIDRLMRVRLGKAIPTARSCLSHVTSELDGMRAQEIYDWLLAVSMPSWDEQVTSGTAQLIHGEIREISRVKGEAIIRSEDGKEYISRRSDLSTASDWSALEVGTKVYFWMLQPDAVEHPIAANVIIDDDPDDSAILDEQW